MLPWDFGILNAIKSELLYAIFPSHPPQELRKTPYLIFELKKIQQNKNLSSRAEFTITVVDDDSSGNGLKILKNINKIISKELTLYQSDCIIGSAKIKIDSVENKKNNLLINLIAILTLKAIYEDEQILDGEHYEQ